MKITLLSASITGTKSRLALEDAKKYLLKHAPAAEITLLDLKEMTILFADGRNYVDYPADTEILTKNLMAADIIVIATPTFQASIPGTLKNVFDLLPQQAFFHKIVSLIISAGSPKHFLMAENQLKPILHYMKANTLPNYLFIEQQDFANGTIINSEVHRRLNNLMEETIVLFDAYQTIWQKQKN